MFIVGNVGIQNNYVESKHKQVTGMFANIWNDPINQSVIQEGPE